MPKDKRLIITTAIVNYVRKKLATSKKGTADSIDPAGSVPILLDFVVPSKHLFSSALSLTTAASQSISGKVTPNSKDRKKRGGEVSSTTTATTSTSSSVGLSSKWYALNHSVHCKNGRQSILIVSRNLFMDCLKLNKRRGFFDAVLCIEDIANWKQDPVHMRKATQVSSIFSKFVIEESIAHLLPLVIQKWMDPTKNNNTVVKNTEHQKSAASAIYQRCHKYGMVVNLSEEETLSVQLSQASNCVPLFIVPESGGLCVVRVGHAGMNAGEITENCKSVISSIRVNFPSLYKAVGEFRLVSAVTEPIRFYQANLSA